MKQLSRNRRLSELLAWRPAGPPPTRGSRRVRLARPNTSPKLSLLRFAIVLAVLVPQAALAMPFLRTFHNVVPGEPVTLRLAGVTPGAEAVIVAGREVVPGATCVGAVCLDIPAARVVARATADTVGAIEVDVPVPAAIGIGGTVAFQAIELGNGAVSTAILRTATDHVGLFGVWDDPSGYWPQTEIDDQGTRDASGYTTELSDFDLAGQVAYETWLRPNGWYYWDRLDWTTSAGSTWMCRSMLTPYENVVRQQGRPDASDPSTRGCMGGAWTQLNPAPPAIAGDWRGPGGQQIHIDADGWTVNGALWAASRFSNLDQRLIGTDATGRWWRLDWTFDGGPRVCTSVRAASSEWQARNAPTPDAADPAHGCAGGPWLALQ